MGKNTTAIEGGLNIDKPLDMTSHDVVNRVREILRAPAFTLPSSDACAGGRRRRLKVGHAGTLDPFATDVLLILLGRATKLMPYINRLPKTYIAQITLGASSDTDDSTGRLRRQPVSKPPTASRIKNTLKKFVGTIDQVPPAYAAIKVKGKKLYQYARAGQAVSARPRRVTIHAIRLLEYAYPTIRIKVDCGSGTYIRALARDIGEALGTGAYLSSLKRTAIGPFKSRDSVALNALTSKNLVAHLIPMNQLVSHLPSITISSEKIAKLQQGNAVICSQKLPSDKPVAVFGRSQSLVAIGRFDPATGLLTPKRVL